MGGRRFTLVSCVAAVLACNLVACGLELNGLGDVPLDASTTPSTTLGDGSVSQIDATGGTTLPPATTGQDAGASPADAALSSDSSSPPPADPPDADDPDVIILDPDASAPPGDPCDLDQDGYKSTSSGCGGNDCCDYDGRANPGDTAYYTSADACGSFDYNCNGKDDPEYGEVDCTLGFFTCNGSGFQQTPPACGATAKYETCNLGFFTCNTSQSQVTQACR